jgi:hypothetical protein
MLNSMPDGRSASAPDPFLLSWRRLARSGIAALLLSFARFAGALAAEAPVATEHNPPGDIPDTQVFVAYDSPLGFTIKVPEGWARREAAGSVHFSDKYDAIDISVVATDTPLTLASAKAKQTAEITSAERAAKIGKIKEVKVASGPAILISYTSNSAPNPTTNKQIRLEHDRYLFYKDGKLASLDLSAPKGADNVDDWSMMANAFKWR